MLMLDNFSAMLKERMVPCFDEANTQQDLLARLKGLPHLNVVPLIIKRHFNRPE